MERVNFLRALIAQLELIQTLKNSRQHIRLILVLVFIAVIILLVVLIELCEEESGLVQPFQTIHSRGHLSVEVDRSLDSMSRQDCNRRILTVHKIFQTSDDVCPR